MTSQHRPPNRRLPSGPWSRLMPANIDPLDAYGLPSKGETRLNDYRAQEQYYQKIVDRYMKFCADRGNVNELEKAFAAVALGENESHAQQRSNAPNNGKLHKPQGQGESFASAPAAQAELHLLMHSMRKLREAIVATSRRDLFAQRAYVFIIHASILVRHFQSYHPALLYLLRVIYPRQPLPPPELHEFIGYRILDLCCREGDLQEAYRIKFRYDYKDRRIDRVLHAVAHDDWVTFWRMRKAVDGHQRALMGHKVEDLRMHALKCLGKTYMTAEREFVERSADLEWKGLVRTCGVGWELDSKGEVVTIRKPKVKPPA